MITRTRPAPYRHTDGSNCWTKNCSRNTKNFTPDSFMISLVKAMNNALTDEEAIRQAIKVFGPKQTPNYRIPQTMKDVTFAGKTVNSKFKFRSTIVGEYDTEKFTLPSNPVELGWTKPDGGLWLATVDETGEDSWTQHLGSLSTLSRIKKTPLNKIKQLNFEFTPEAKILIINSKEDYEMILDHYPYYTSEHPDDINEYVINGYGGREWSQLNEDGTPRRGIDWVKLQADGYGAVLLTWEGLNIASQDKNSKNISLKRWELESAFVLNPNVITVTGEYVAD